MNSTVRMGMVGVGEEEEEEEDGRVVADGGCFHVLSTLFGFPLSCSA